MKDIIKKYKNKIETYNENEYYLYNDNKINEELKLEEIIRNIDKNINEITIFVCTDNIKENKNKIKESNDMSLMQRIIVLDIIDYKIQKKCKNNHNKILLIKDYYNEIDISKINCHKCNKNRYELNNNEFFICFNCDINLCSLCLAKHDKSHNYINYDDKNCICNKHNKFYTKYCCNKNLCIECEKEHSEHNIIEFNKILQNINKNNEIKEYINKLNNEIKDLINKLNE